MSENSGFQFTTPKLRGLIFQLNDSYSGPQNIKIENIFDTNITHIDSEEHIALVSLSFHVENANGDLPFKIDCVIDAKFRWDDSFDETTLSILLNQNAPALLLSYLRPIVFNITSSALPGGGYSIPFMNFTKRQQD